MPRRIRRKQETLSTLKLPGFTLQSSEREKPRDPRTLKYDKYGEPATREQYLTTGLGRRISEETRANILAATRLTARAIVDAGIAYVPGLEMAKRVKYGLAGESHLTPEEAVENVLSSNVRQSSESSEVITIFQDLAIKRFGTEMLKIVAIVSDVPNSDGDPTILTERIKWMEHVGLTQLPKMKETSLVSHVVDLALTDMYSLTIARNVAKPALSSLQSMQITLEPVSPIQTAFPVNY